MHPCLWMYVVLCMCLAFCVGCIVCAFKMDGYMEDMDKEKEWRGRWGVFVWFLYCPEWNT